MRLPHRLRAALKKRELKRFYRKFIRPDDLCYDIGANEGSRTEVFFQLGARVVAVEPQQHCAQILEYKFWNNSKITVVQAALGSYAGEAELMICEEASDCSTLSKDFVELIGKTSDLHWKKSEKVKLYTLDQLCEQYGHPAFCKIDVEGYESEVFMGLSRAVKTIVFEFNRPLLHDTIKCLDILEGLGNYRCNLIHFEFMKLVLPKDLPLKEFREKLYSIIPEHVLTGEIIATNKSG